MKELFDSMPQVGRVEWIGIRPAKRGEIMEVQEVQVHEEAGLEGDHYGKAGGKRMVTLIQAEHMQAMASILKKEVIDPKLLRRNIVVAGVNLLALKEQRFQIGEVLLETTGNCHPCSRMEKNLGAGGYNAMRGHGGITARVVEGGRIRVGDKVQMKKEQTVKI